MNDQNLRSLADRPEEERKEIARAGGIASGKSRRRSKEMRSLISDILSKKCELSFGSQLDPFGDDPRTYSIVGYEPETVAEAVALILCEKALTGDFKALSAVLECVGE